jgi:hypothetical protein
MQHAPEYNQAAHCGGNHDATAGGRHRRVVQPALTAADIDTHEHRGQYIDAIIAATHRDADVNASTAYRLADFDVPCDGGDGDVDGDSDGNDGSDGHDSDQRPHDAP